MYNLGSVSIQTVDIFYNADSISKGNQEMSRPYLGSG